MFWAICISSYWLTTDLCLKFSSIEITFEGGNANFFFLFHFLSSEMKSDWFFSLCMKGKIASSGADHSS